MGSQHSLGLADIFAITHGNTSNYIVGTRYCLFGWYNDYTVILMVIYPVTIAFINFSFVLRVAYFLMSLLILYLLCMLTVVYCHTVTHHCLHLVVISAITTSWYVQSIILATALGV